MPVFSLSAHAGYACRHRGACCTAGWRIPVEPEQRRFIPVETLVPDASGACTFYDRPTGLCRVHRDHGPAALPRSCDQFPRLSLRDARGTFVTLSHFCPTAAALLVADDAPLRIVESPAAFPEDRFYDALDGRREWPPLLRPSALFDLDTYSRWERFLVATLADEGASIATRLDIIASSAEALRAWSPASGELAAYARAVFARPHVEVHRPEWYREFSGPGAYARVCGMTRAAGGASPSGATGHDRAGVDADAFDRADWGAFSPAAARYLAAKAFGSWCAYQARGVRTLVAELIVSETVLRVEAVRLAAAAGGPLTPALMIAALQAADWLLVHSVDREQLVAWLGTAEAEGR